MTIINSSRDMTIGWPSKKTKGINKVLIYRVITARYGGSGSKESGQMQRQQSTSCEVYYRQETADYASKFSVSIIKNIVAYLC